MAAVQILFEFISTQNVPLVELAMCNTSRVRVRSREESLAGASISIKNLSKDNVRQEMMQIDWLSAVEGTQRFIVSLSYSDDKSKIQRQECWLNVPFSAFIVPSKISLDELTRIITGQNFYPAAQPITLSKHVLTEALSLVSIVLNVAFVDTNPLYAAYYGKISTDQINKSHVAVYIKGKKGDDKLLNAEVRTNKQELSDLLLNELVTYLQIS